MILAKWLLCCDALPLSGYTKAISEIQAGRSYSHLDKKSDLNLIYIYKVAWCQGISRIQLSNKLNYILKQNSMKELKTASQELPKWQPSVPSSLMSPHELSVVVTPIRRSQLIVFCCRRTPKILPGESNSCILTSQALYTSQKTLLRSQIILHSS